MDLFDWDINDLTYNQKKQLYDKYRIKANQRLKAIQSHGYKIGIYTRILEELNKIGADKFYAAKNEQDLNVKLGIVQDFLSHGTSQYYRQKQTLNTIYDRMKNRRPDFKVSRETFFEIAKREDFYQIMTSKHRSREYDSTQEIMRIANIYQNIEEEELDDVYDTVQEINEMDKIEINDFTDYIKYVKNKGNLV